MNYLATYFKAKPIDVYIMIIYSINDTQKTEIILEQLKFFKNKTDIIQFLRDNESLRLETRDSIKSEKIKRFIQGIEEYLSGKKLNLVDEIRKLNIELSLEEKFPTNFSSQVLNYLLKLNYGEITSYSQIGSEIGSKAYRAIGNILKKNPLPLIIPCHRIIKKNGEYGGFMGKIEGGWQQDLKSKLLEIESHNFE